MKSGVKQQFYYAARKVFISGLSALALVAGGGCMREADKPTPAPPPVVEPVKQQEPIKEERITRGLTEGEAKLAKTFFGETFDVGQVTVNMNPAQNDNTPTFVYNNSTTEVTVNGRKYYSEDYSRDSNGFLYSAFVHELTRLWQNSQGQNWRGHPTHNEYLYPLRTDLSFDHYGRFQQASILEDYARRMLHPDHRGNGFERMFGEKNCNADDFLIAVVENKFPQLKQARHAVEFAGTRTLTDKEIALIGGIFGTEIKLDDVRIHPIPRSCGGNPRASVNSVRDIYAFGAENHSSDYSANASAAESDKLGVVIHEATHVWQFQKGFKHTHWQFVNPGNKYSYPINLNKWSFDHYSTEQQGALVQDYSLLFLTSAKKSYWLRSVYGDSDHNSSLVRILVENRFPQAKKTREHFEATGQLPPLPVQEPPPLKTAQAPKLRTR